MKKRVLFVIGTPLLYAGVPNVAMTIVRELHHEYIFDVLCLNEETGDYDAEFVSYGGKIYRMNVTSYSNHKLIFIKRMLQIWNRLKKLIQRNQYSVVHCHCGIDAGICLAVAQKYGVANRIAHAHGTYIRKGKNIVLRFYNWLSKKMIISYSTHRLACSDIAGKTLYLNRDFDNVLNPVDIEYYQTVEKQEHQGLNLMQIGYFCRNKNQLFSLRVMNELKKKGVPATIRFIGYASEPDYVDEMYSYIHAHGLEEYVSLLPKDVDKRKHLGEIDYTLVPSESEGLPLVALESQAANVPCVLSNNVPADVNMGLAHYLSVEELDAWVEFFSSPSHASNCLDPRIFQLTPNKYAEKIGQAYECS